MNSVNSTIDNVNNLPKIKKLILIIMVIVIVLFLVDLILSYNKQNYDNVINHSKKNSNKIENLETSMDSVPNNMPENTELGDLSLDPEKTNISLYFAHWCGHCKQFMSSTWNQIKEEYGNNPGVKLNDIDCTNLKSEIKTAAGKTIQGFPTVIINYKDKDGEYIEEEYSGGRSYSVFSAYVEKFVSK